MNIFTITQYYIKLINILTINLHTVSNTQRDREKFEAVERNYEDFVIFLHIYIIKGFYNSENARMIWCSISNEQNYNFLVIISV